MCYTYKPFYIASLFLFGVGIYPPRKSPVYNCGMWKYKEISSTKCYFRGESKDAKK